MQKNKFGCEIEIATCESERILNKNMSDTELKLRKAMVENFITNHKITNGVFGFLNEIYDEISYLESKRTLLKEFNITSEVK